MVNRKVERIIGSIFAVVGVVLMSTPDFLTTTGHSIASNATSSLDVIFLLALVLTILGGTLFFRSFKK
jgi:hypothetical protein